jgi:hypothetical protein
MGNAITPSVPTATGTWRGTGILYKEYGEGTEREIGASREDIIFTDSREFRNIDFNGKYGPIEGNTVITESVQTLKFSLLELTYQNFEDCWAGLAVSDEGAYHQVTGDLAIAAGDYHENVAWWGERHDAKYAGILLNNALGDGSIEANIKDKEDLVIDVQFTAHYGTATPTTPPWSIRLED